MVSSRTSLKESDSMPYENEEVDPDWTIVDWVKKLKQQAEDSKGYRHKLYERVDLRNKEHILDVGCGTGAVTMDIAQYTKGDVIGIDIDREKFKEAEKVLSEFPNVTLIEGDALDLPFEDETFDLVVFSVVLIYIKDQQKALHEMARVTKKGGYVLATLEPDYEKRIDYPETRFVPLLFQRLREIGADLQTGRKLKYLFSNAGLKTEMGMDTETDEYILTKDDTKHLETFDREFWVFEKLFLKDGWNGEEIEKYRNDERERIKNGLSFHFNPCFYAIGKKV